MNKLPAHEIVSIGQAAGILGVSIDTLRRWDKSGKITSTRINGKNRYFKISDLEEIKLKSQEKLSISKAAKTLGVSPSTLRRYEKEGFIKPEREGKGDRVYSKEILSNFEKPRQVEVSFPGKLPSSHQAIRQPNSERKWQAPSSFIIIVLLLTTILSTLYVKDQYERNQQNISSTASRVLGAKDSGGVLGFFGRVTGIFKNTNKRLIEQYKIAFGEGEITNINEVFEYDEEGNLVPKVAINITKPELLKIKETVVIQNLDAESLQGRVPGGDEGDLAYFSSGGRIAVLKISGLNILSGVVSGGVGGIILDSSITSEDLADDAVSSSEILNATIVNADIANGAINSAKIEDGTVTTSDISDNTVDAGDLSDTITFADGNLLNLSAIDHSTTSIMGLILPNVPSASPTSPSTGEGYLAYDTANDQVLVFNGSSWAQIGGSITLTSSGESTNTSSNSGLELSSDQLALIRGCSDTQVLKWNETSKVWACGDDSGAAGAGISTVQEGDVTKLTAATIIDFLGADFNVTDAGGGEADISIDYSGSSMVRKNQDETVTGSWIFNGGVTFNNSITANDASADNILLGQNGTTPDTVTITGNVSITDSNWSISATGATTGLSGVTASAIPFSGVSAATNTNALVVGTGGSLSTSGSGTITATDLSCTDCIGPTEISDLTLGTNTAGNYVDNVTGGSGISVTGSADEGWEPAVALGALTADWAQNGAFDVVLSNAGSELKIKESAGDTYYAIFDAGDLSADATFTFSGSTGVVLTSTNYSGTLDSIYVNVGENPASGDISGSFSGGLTIGAEKILESHLKAVDMAADEECLTYETTTGDFEWQACGGGGGSLDQSYDLGGTITVDAYGVLFNLNDATNDYGLVVDNTTTGEIATAVEITTTGAGATFVTGFDISDAGITNAINIGTNNIVTGATTLASTELDILDGGIAFSELTDSGTLTATTVDINGGNVDGTVIGASSAVAGTFSTITANTSVTAPSYTGSEAVTLSSGGTSVLTLDSASGVVTIAAGDVVSTSLAGNPGSPAAGMIWYDSTAGKYKINEGGVTKVLCNATDAACGAGSGSAWSAISVPVANLSLSHSAYTTGFDWTATGALDPWTMSLSNNAGSATTQRFVNIINAITSQVTDINTETLLRIDNADTSVSGSTVVDDAILITNSGGITNGITDAIDVSAAEIVNAINIGTNNIVTGATTLASTELDILDGGIAFSELTDSGTLTATTVDINGGNVDGTAIGVSSQSTGAFTTLSSTGATALGNNSSTVAIDGTNFDLTTAGAITLTGHVTLSGDASEGLSGGGLVDCDNATTSKLLWDTTTNKFSCGTDQTGGGESTLQGAYDIGGSVTTSDARDFDVVLANTTTDSNFDIDIAVDSTSTVSISRLDGLDTAFPTQLLILENLDATGTIANGLMITGATGGAITDAINVADAEIVNAINIGANNIITAATTLASTELDILDAGIVYTELTDTGTLTVTTVDINGGNIDATAIGVTNQTTGAFTTLSSTGATTLGNNSSTVAIDGTNFDLTTAGAVTLTGHVTLSGDASEGLSGGGLVDCDNATTSKLLWDATTNKFSCGTDQTGGGGATWDTIGDAAAPGAIAMAQNAQTLDWTMASDAALDGLKVTITNNLVTDTSTQRALVISNLDDAIGTGTTERLLVLDNVDANEAVTTALEILASSTGTITTAIDISDAEIATALAIGANDITTAATTLASTELDILDAGILLSELTDTGTLTAGTVDINGGNIDATAIGVTNQSTGAFSTISATGAITAPTTTDTINGLIINSGALSGILTIGLSGAISGGTTLGLSQAITGATTTDTINGLIINSGALSGATTLSSSGDWTWTATTPTITVNTDETLTISDAGGAFNFSVATGPSYTGDARPTKRIAVSPEYSGATLTGDTTSNTGTMTSDSMTTTPYRNYYRWANTQGTVQDYDIWVRIPIPNDFSAMAATPTLSIDTYTSDLTNGTVLVTVYDSQATPVADCTDAVFTPTGAINTWETKTSTTCLDTGTYTAGGFMTVKIKLTGAATTGITQVSDIYFDYLAKF